LACFDQRHGLDAPTIRIQRPANLNGDGYMTLASAVQESFNSSSTDAHSLAPDQPRHSRAISSEVWTRPSAVRIHACARSKSRVHHLYGEIFELVSLIKSIELSGSPVFGMRCHHICWRSVSDATPTRFRKLTIVATCSFVLRYSRRTMPAGGVIRGPNDPIGVDSEIRYLVRQ
jgi:hypothetical protein